MATLEGELVIAGSHGKDLSKRLIAAGIGSLSRRSTSRVRLTFMGSYGCPEVKMFSSLSETSLRSGFVTLGFAVGNLFWKPEQLRLM